MKAKFKYRLWEMHWYELGRVAKSKLAKGVAMGLLCFNIYSRDDQAVAANSVRDIALRTETFRITVTFRITYDAVYQ